MKRISFFAAVLFLATMFCTSCKDDSDSNVNTKDSQLIGTWEGSMYTSYINDEPVGDPIIVTFEFTADRFVWTSDGSVVVNSPYICNESPSDGKYFQWTEGNKQGGDAVFYSISENTMTIRGANGSIIMSLPETLTKK